jgi:hypothetical protein
MDKSTVIEDIAGNIQAGDVVRLPGMANFRKVHEVTGATANLSRRVLVTVHLTERIEAVHNGSPCEFLIPSPVW